MPGARAPPRVHLPARPVTAVSRSPDANPSSACPGAPGCRLRATSPVDDRSVVTTSSSRCLARSSASRCSPIIAALAVRANPRHPPGRGTPFPRDGEGRPRRSPGRAGATRPDPTIAGCRRGRTCRRQDASRRRVARSEEATRAGRRRHSTAAGRCNGPMPRPQSPPSDCPDGATLHRSRLSYFRSAIDGDDRRSTTGAVRPPRIATTGRPRMLWRHLVSALLPRSPSARAGSRSPASTPGGEPVPAPGSQPETSQDRTASRTSWSTVMMCPSRPDRFPAPSPLTSSDVR
jgi:hypothetical protein